MQQKRDVFIVSDATPSTASEGLEAASCGTPFRFGGASSASDTDSHLFESTMMDCRGSAKGTDESLKWGKCACEKLDFHALVNFVQGKYEQWKTSIFGVNQNVIR